MELEHEYCYSRIQNRDRRYDGLFFTVVHTTGIYCRPICPARTPLSRNVSFVRSSAEALSKGFRPCLRCRPESAPGSRNWLEPSGVLSRSLQLIADGALDEADMQGLSQRLGVSPRHLRRLYTQYLGTTPKKLALTRRLETARRYLAETDLSMTDLAFASGFSSLRSFHSAFRKHYQARPSDLRRQVTAKGKGVQLRLAFRPPYDWNWVQRYLKARALPRVEHVDSSTYRRQHWVDGEKFEVRLEWRESHFQLSIEGEKQSRALAHAIRDATRRANRLLDLHLTPQPMMAHLGRDKILAPWLEGTRLCQSWDRFEMMIRAILGQQISVKAATTLASRLVDAFSLTGAFPRAEELLAAPLEDIGVTSARAQTIRDVAKFCSLGRRLDDPANLGSLGEIKGIGPWTLGYLGMRVSGDPDGFCEGDLVLRKMCENCSKSELKKRAENWRPWRAYAAMALWKGASSCVTS